MVDFAPLCRLTIVYSMWNAQDAMTASNAVSQALCCL